MCFCLCGSGLVFGPFHLLRTHLGVSVGGSTPCRQRVPYSWRGCRGGGGG